MVRAQQRPIGAGRSCSPLRLPKAPGLVGLTLHAQAVLTVDGALTNAIFATIGR